jgi:hypothetical protein
VKYWKNGFYPIEIEGSVEITDEQWQELLESQSNGKQIVTGDGGVPVAVEPVLDINMLASSCRSFRNTLIESAQKRVDRYKRQLAMGIPTVDNLSALYEYMQILADVPQQEGFPINIVWPEVP